MSTLNGWLKLRMAAVSPRSQDFCFMANPTNSSPGSSESVPLLVPMSRLLRDADTASLESSNSEINRDCSEKSLNVDISDIISPLVFNEQNMKEETMWKPTSLESTSSDRFSYSYSQEHWREMDSPWGGKIPYSGGIDQLSIESDEERFSTASCCCFRYFNATFYFPLKFWSTKSSRN